MFFQLGVRHVCSPRFSDHGFPVASLQRVGADSKEAVWSEEAPLCCLRQSVLKAPDLCEKYG